MANADLAKLLPARRWRPRIVILVLVALMGAAWLLANGGADSKSGHFVTAPADRGELRVTVAASGTLQPVRTVDVGSELSGTIVSVAAEENDRVRKGEIMATLDRSRLEDQVNKSRAARALAKAAMRQTEATLAEAAAALERLRQVAVLSGGKVPSSAEMEIAQAAQLRAQAALAGSQAQVAQAEATLKSDATSLTKTIIRAPISGVVLTRKVEPGQTVVAAMNAPVLFNLAEDLRQMELAVKVDEADVAQLRVGQKAGFSVAAWSGRRFDASVRRIGMGATLTDNVVTYKTVLTVSNDDLALRPGMTAAARIEVAQRVDVLRVPNAALRFTPPDASKVASSSLISRLLPKPPRGTRSAVTPTRSGATQIWVLSDGEAKAVPVTAGLSDGRYTEVVAGDLQPGMEVITEYRESAAP